MKFSTKPERKHLVQGKLSTDEHTSAGEVKVDALLLPEDHKRILANHLADFCSEIDRRLASLDRGEGIDGETVFARIRESSNQRRHRNG